MEKGTTDTTTNGSKPRNDPQLHNERVTSVRKQELPRDVKNKEAYFFFPKRTRDNSEGANAYREITTRQAPGIRQDRTRGLAPFVLVCPTMKQIGQK